jgi:tryptophan synthase alpha chain
VSRLEQRFADLAATGRKALVPYITAGDPEPGATVALMHAMVEAGADILELGVPFSDPQADGPVIQEACERALAHGVSLADVLGMVARFREGDAATPVVLMGYLNPVEIMGYARFAEQASAAGVDGLLTVDLPPEEAGGLLAPIEEAGIDPIFLLAPTSDAARIELICSRARGFVYYVSLKGVTGAATLDVPAVAERLRAIRTVARTPVGVGFGISDAAMAARVAEIADAVVVGSAIVRRIAEHARDPAAATASVCALIREMRAAMDRAAEAA